MIPTFTEAQNPAWRDFREGVGALQFAREQLEQAQEDARARVRTLEDNEVVRDQQITALLSYSESQTRIIEKLVTQQEFSPFKTLVFGLCVFMVVVMLIFLTKGGR